MIIRKFARTLTASTGLEDVQVDLLPILDLQQKTPLAVLAVQGLDDVAHEVHVQVGGMPALLAKPLAGPVLAVAIARPRLRVHKVLLVELVPHVARPVELRVVLPIVHPVDRRGLLDQDEVLVVRHEVDPGRDVLELAVPDQADLCPDESVLVAREDGDVVQDEAEDLPVAVQHLTGPPRKDALLCGVQGLDEALDGVLLEACCFPGHPVNQLRRQRLDDLVLDGVMLHPRVRELGVDLADLLNGGSHR